MGFRDAKLLKYTIIFISLGTLAACASRGTDLPPAPGVILAPSEDMQDGMNRPSPVAKARPHRKIGKPYKVAGIWYYPKVDKDYVATGTGSWYGPKFHGRLTANGEIFDMNRLSAAHPTLPLPSIVEVTNLSNGRSIILRVNDRGPFAHGRVIDLSRAAARKIGYENKGLAQVRVRYIGEAKMSDAIIALGTPETNDPEVVMAAASLSPDMGTVQVRVATGPEEASEPNWTHAVIKNPTTQAPVVGRPAQPAKITNASANGLYLVQVGAFSSAQNANKASLILSDTQPVRTSRLKNASGRALYHVRLGPFASRSDAERARADAVSAGFGDARIFQP